MLQHTDVNSWFHDLLAATHDLVINERIHDKANSTGESDDEEVSDTIFGDNSQSPCHDRHDENVQETTQHSEDPFGFYKLLKKPINCWIMVVG
nr:hypothetical protein [Tanacetum cinerariifolium]